MGRFGRGPAGDKSAARPVGPGPGGPPSPASGAEFGFVQGRPGRPARLGSSYHGPLPRAARDDRSLFGVFFFLFEILCQTLDLPEVFGVGGVGVGDSPLLVKLVVPLAGDPHGVVVTHGAGAL